MLNLFEKLKLKTKFRFAIFLLVLSSSISIVGMLEIAKTGRLQKFERDHIAMTTLLDFKARDYIDILKNNPSDSLAEELLNAKSARISEMGIYQLLQGIMKQSVGVLEIINIIEQKIFRIFGFGKAYDMAPKDIVDCKNAQKILNDFKNESITLDDFAESFLASINIMHKNSRIFSSVVMDVASFTKKVMITLSLFFLAISVSFLIILARMINKSLSQVTTMLDESSQQLTSSSSQLSSAAQSLSQGASEQAASNETASSSLEEISSMTKQNSENTGKADIYMKNTNNTVDSADNSMKKLTISMSEIADAGEETSKIIKTIDEIAFQTNLLALNAAVEAARAGDAGSGFAVVADEVRNLAMRATDAAKNTATLIQEIIEKINSGSSTLENTANSFSEVKENTTKVGELIGEIATSSNEQSLGIEEVNVNVTQMAEVTQQTAATAEETASASVEMNNQIEQMKKILLKLMAIVHGKKKEI